VSKQDSMGSNLLDRIRRCTAAREVALQQHEQQQHRRIETTEPAATDRRRAKEAVPALQAQGQGVETGIVEDHQRARGKFHSRLPMKHETFARVISQRGRQGSSRSTILPPGGAAIDAGSLFERPHRERR